MGEAAGTGESVDRHSLFLIKLELDGCWTGSAASNPRHRRKQRVHRTRRKRKKRKSLHHFLLLSASSLSSSLLSLPSSSSPLTKRSDNVIAHPQIVRDRGSFGHPRCAFVPLFSSRLLFPPFSFLASPRKVVRPDVETKDVGRAVTLVDGDFFDVNTFGTPSPRFLAQSGSKGTKFYVHGGVSSNEYGSNSNTSLSDELWCFHSNNYTWILVDHFPSFLGAAGTVVGDLFMTFGGLDNSGSLTNSLRLYDLGLNPSPSFSIPLDLKERTLTITTTTTTR